MSKISTQRALRTRWTLGAYNRLDLLRVGGGWMRLGHKEDPVYVLSRWQGMEMSRETAFIEVQVHEDLQWQYGTFQDNKSFSIFSLSRANGHQTVRDDINILICGTTSTPASQVQIPEHRRASPDPRAQIPLQNAYLSLCANPEACKYTNLRAFTIGPLHTLFSFPLWFLA